MKWVQVVVVVISIAVAAMIDGANGADSCFANVQSSCDGQSGDLSTCNTALGGFATQLKSLQSLANAHMLLSYAYLLISKSFGSYVRARPGFEKLFAGMSERAWQDGIYLMKEIAKRGGPMDLCQTVVVVPFPIPGPKNYDLSEIEAIAYALETKKWLAKITYAIHKNYSNSNSPSYDAQFAFYLGTYYIQVQLTAIRYHSGTFNDVRRIEEGEGTDLALFLYDEFLLSSC